MNGQSLKVGRVHTASLLAADGSHVQISSNIHDEAILFSSTKNGQPAVKSGITPFTGSVSLLRRGEDLRLTSAST